MALPNLSGLSLHAAAPTSKFVRYYAADYAALDDETRKEKAHCPISLEPFKEGQLVYQATKEEGGSGLYYRIENYLHWLEVGNGCDPCTRLARAPHAVRKLRDEIVKEAAFQEDLRMAKYGVKPPDGFERGGYYGEERATLLRRVFEDWDQIRLHQIQQQAQRARERERQRLRMTVEQYAAFQERQQQARRERQQQARREREAAEAEAERRAREREAGRDAREAAERAERDEWRRQQGWIDGAPPPSPGSDSDGAGITEEDLFGES